MVPAYEGKNPYIFVSYAHKDSELVLPIIEELYNAKYRVWYDEGIAPGSEWPKNIADHLNGASGVIYFISENSIASPNCENEVARACSTDKFILQYTLDGHKHRLLGDAQTVFEKDELRMQIPEKFLGDGSGYDRNISRKKFGALWNVLLILAGVFVIVLGIGLYGLNQGWFDAYLPGVSEAEETATKITKKNAIKNESVEFSDDALASALAAQVGKEDLYGPIQFRDDWEKNEFYNCIGWDRNQGEMKYEDLIHNDRDSIYIENATDNILNCMKYLPNLREIHIRNGEITGVDTLKDCPNLETVKIDYGMFPLEIPQDAEFRILLME